MNGNCPAGFNHVLNWQKNRRKALLQQLRIDPSGSLPVATPLYLPITKARTPLYRHVRAPVSVRMTAALITLMASWKIGGWGWKMVVKKLNSGVQVSILPSECWLWQETERSIIVSSRVWLPSLSLFSTNKEHFTICISCKFLVGGWQGDALKPFIQLIHMHEACKWQTRMVLYSPVCHNHSIIGKLQSLKTNP